MAKGAARLMYILPCVTDWEGFFGFQHGHALSQLAAALAQTVRVQVFRIVHGPEQKGSSESKMEQTVQGPGPV